MFMLLVVVIVLFSLLVKVCMWFVLMLLLVWVKLSNLLNIVMFVFGLSGKCKFVRV